MTAKKNQDEAKRQEMAKIIKDMKKKLDELDEIRKEIKMQRLQGINPEKSKAMLEEIKVPSLRMIKERSKT